MKPNRCGRTARLKSFCITLSSYLTLGLSLLAAMLTLEFLWSGSLSGLSVYLIVTSLFVIVLAMLKCTDAATGTESRLRRERVK
jgi:hypothetical protein